MIGLYRIMLQTFDWLDNETFKIHGKDVCNNTSIENDIRVQIHTLRIYMLLLMSPYPVFDIRITYGRELFILWKSFISSRKVLNNFDWLGGEIIVLCPNKIK